jgi:acylaminoacyl-peptidase
VTTPVLLCLGAADRRVPHHQGIEYYHALRSVSGLPPDCVDMRVYPQADHAIDKPNSEADQFISMDMWFRRFLTTEKTGETEMK